MLCDPAHQIPRLLIGLGQSAAPRVHDAGVLVEQVGDRKGDRQVGL
jgi:hypothetical protein